MSALIGLLHALTGLIRDRVRQARAEPEKGALSVEQVIITLALLGIAVALTVVIANAVTSRSAQIH